MSLFFKFNQKLTFFNPNHDIKRIIKKEFSIFRLLINLIIKFIKLFIINQKI